MRSPVWSLSERREARDSAEKGEKDAWFFSFIIIYAVGARQIFQLTATYLGSPGKIGTGIDRLETLSPVQVLTRKSRSFKLQVVSRIGSFWREFSVLSPTCFFLRYGDFNGESLLTIG